MERIESDHNLIVMKWGENKKVRRPWRFQNMWLEDPRFFQELDIWLGENAQGTGDIFLFARKLHSIKAKLKVWNKEVFGNIDKRVEDLLIKIKELERVEEERILHDGEREERAKLEIDLRRDLFLQEICWRQKSREVWVKLGDKNSGYFHQMANYRRKVNRVEKLKIEGRNVDDPVDVASGIVRFYQNLFKEDLVCRPFPCWVWEHHLEELDKVLLCRDFTEEEIWDALRECDGSKAPGPDGFTLEFFKRGWSCLKSEVLRVFKEFHSTGALPKCVKHSFVCLAPKKDVVEEIKDLRPINLIGSINKLINKVLSKRLGVVLPKLISKQQHSSVKGRQIAEAGLIANEVVESRRKSRKPGLMFKLDIEKAFDNVNWGCLLKIMELMGFPVRWRNWVKGSMFDYNVSILINGEANGFFPVSKGLRQGDPISPGLFVMVMDVLSLMLEKVRANGMFEGFFMDEKKKIGEVTHLLYADDTLIFCDANHDQVLNILATLVMFQMVTGLRINLEKSVMYSVGDVADPSYFAAIFGCKWSSESPKYLGYPLGAKPNDRSVWDGIVEKYQNRLNGWGSRKLSYGARLVLINAVLSGSPTYLFSLFKAPKGVIKDLEGYQRRFLWNGKSEGNKMALIEWEWCKSPVKKGGLGIHDLERFNDALLSKWLWRFATERDSWWRGLINSKYPNDLSSWQTKRERHGFSRSVWANISKEYDSFWNYAAIDPGNGTQVSFWHDCWIPGIVLSASFPRVAAAVLDPEARLSDVANTQGELSLQGTLETRG
ncbi:unnamed protein product [Linum tenue]|uniref:Reverse transcriptase domain-containing protein n=1 Tax=Linum tenue TaxID=586396 RepID=A0AAV0NNL3_9ROSI|nr:unnamed protein product [Linum tenue]